MPTEPLIEVMHADFGYRGRTVVRVEGLTVRAGQCLGLYGPNGVGKTTVVRGLVGLLAPLSGTLQRQPSLSTGYVPQHRAMELQWPMTGLDVASLGLSARRRFGWVGSDRHLIREAMEELEVWSLADHPFAALSGGQQQRLILAGALAIAPDLLVLDEPTDGLDQANRSLFLEILRRRTQRAALVLISHEVEDLLELADEVAWFHPGRKAGEPAAVEPVPVDEFSQALAASVERRER